MRLVSLPASPLESNTRHMLFYMLSLDADGATERDDVYALEANDCVATTIVTS